MSRYLNRYGYIVGAIRPPTVPKGTSRLRVAFNSSHTKLQIKNLANLIKNKLRFMGKNKNIFITSTGTNIGKTYCTVEILKEMLHRKVLFNAYKPILSGFNISNIKDSDSYKILKTNNKEPKIEDIREISPWLFEKAIAPSIAAKKKIKA